MHLHSSKWPWSGGASVDTLGPSTRPLDAAQPTHDLWLFGLGLSSGFRFSAGWWPNCGKLCELLRGSGERGQRDSVVVPLMAQLTAPRSCVLLALCTLGHNSATTIATMNIECISTYLRKVQENNFERITCCLLLIRLSAL